MNKLNPSIKHHTTIGVLLSLWIFLFAFFIKPFEHGTMDLRKWILVSLGFSLTAFLCYGLLSIVQNYTYRRLLKWNLGLETMSILLFYLIYSIVTFIYYKSALINGFYGFFDFLINIILKAALVLTPMLIFARRYAIKLIPQNSTDITITGENKLDVLKLKQDDLVCITNSQNYVEIFFMDGQLLKSKLIRTSLKKVQDNFDFLIKIHRSHLINPSHFKAWKNQNTIALTQMELPVSKNYKALVLSL